MASGSEDERVLPSDFVVVVIALQSSGTVISALPGWQMLAVALFLSLTV